MASRICAANSGHTGARKFEEVSEGKSMKRSPRSSSLSPAFRSNLSSYALAASSAGVSLLALAAPCEAEVVYTPAHVLITRNASYSIDLNHDGIADFTISSFARSLAVIAPAGNGVKCLPGSCAFTFAYASAMGAGSPIGSADRFYGSNRVPMAIEGLGLPWDNVRDRYLGLEFEIQGKNHFGWARLSVQFATRQNTWRAQLTGYAYETVAERPIKAGQIKEDNDGDGDSHPAALPVSPVPERPITLGALALGAGGIPLLRKEETGIKIAPTE
jgi:hypothetical protein